MACCPSPNPTKHPKLPKSEVGPYPQYGWDSSGGNSGRIPEMSLFGSRSEERSHQKPLRKSLLGCPKPYNSRHLTASRAFLALSTEQGGGWGRLLFRGDDGSDGGIPKSWSCPKTGSTDGITENLSANSKAWRARGDMAR